MMMMMMVVRVPVMMMMVMMTMMMMVKPRDQTESPCETARRDTTVGNKKIG